MKRIICNLLKRALPGTCHDDLFEYDSMTEYCDILRDFELSWKTLDPELIFRHLDARFKYSSQWTFSTMKLREYILYLKAHFKMLKESRIKVRAEILHNYSTDEPVLRLTQGEEICFYRIEVNNGKVVRGDLCMY